MRKTEIGWRDVDAEGVKREVMAVRDGYGYHFKYKLKGDDEWTKFRKTTPELLDKLLEIMELRYRRRRASYKEIEVIEKMIKAQK
jgi:hypothetical protein